MAAAMALAAVLLLACAAACDLRACRIPNFLTLIGAAIGLGWHVWHGGIPELLWAGEGMALALPLLLLWAVGGLGAGDIKLLGAVGALLGPEFLLWTLLGTVLAGGFLALIVLAKSRSVRGRMPLAPAIALGAAFAFVYLHLCLHLRFAG